MYLIVILFIFKIKNGNQELIIYCKPNFDGFLVVEFATG